jgi:hypothetical protein
MFHGMNRIGDEMSSRLSHVHRVKREAGIFHSVKGIGGNRRHRTQSAEIGAIGRNRRHRTESAPSDGIGAIGRNRGSGAIGRNRESGASGGPPRPDGADPRRAAAVQRPTSYLPAGCDAESDDPAGRSGVVAFCQEHPRLDGAGGLHHDRVRELVVEALLRRALVGRVEQIDLIDEDDEPDDGSDRRQDVDDLGQ